MGNKRKSKKISTAENLQEKKLGNGNKAGLRIVEVNKLACHQINED